MESTKFRNKKTGEIVTQFSILQINDYEKISEEDRTKLKELRIDTEKWFKKMDKEMLVKNPSEAVRFLEKIINKDYQTDKLIVEFVRTLQTGF